MTDVRTYVVHYDVTTTIKSYIDVDFDEVREWMAESDIDGEPTLGDVADFAQAGPDPLWDQLNDAATDSEDRGDYANLRIIEETS